MGRRAPVIVLGLAAALLLVFITLQGRAVPVPAGPPGKVACVSYAPFTADQTPFDPALVIPPEQIERDMAVLTALSDCVRTYSMGQGLERVVEIAGRHGLRVYAGAWIGRDAAANAREIERLIAVANAHPEILKGVIVGNEVLLRGEQTTPALAGYLRQVRDGVPASVPVTYADVWEFWLEHPELTQAVDFVTVHILPYWEDEPTSVVAAVDHVMAVWAEVSAHYAPKPVLIGETGWPSMGRRREAAQPGPVEQAAFVRGFLSAATEAGAAYNLIEAFDQPWKRALEGTVGGAWGLFDATRGQKVALAGPVVPRADAWMWAAGAVAAGLLPLAIVRLRRERASSALLAAGGIVLAATLVLQLWHMAEASRDGWEWAVNGGWFVVSLGLGLAVLRHLVGLPCRLSAATAQLWMTAGMAVASLGLLFESRYRDMPVSMFLAGALFLVLLRPRPLPETRAVAVLLAVSALGVLVNEGWLNTHAWVWTVTALMLSGAAARRPAQAR